jgi:hypothetical protein
MREWQKGRLAKRALVIAALGGILTSGSANAAFNWCALPDLMPKVESDFERLAPLVEPATGCKREATESAHDAQWWCAGNESASGEGRILIKLVRTPGEGITLLVGGAGLVSLDRLRACGRGVGDGSKFEAGNVAHRDQLTFDYGTRAFTLLGMGPHTIGVAYSGRRFGNDSLAVGLLQGLFGIEAVSYPSTRVRLAGVDPLSTDVFALVQAFEKRGSVIMSSKGQDQGFPEWALTAPTGLPGVTQVEISGFVRHMLDTSYQIASLDDYQRYVTLLDGEYGTSSRSTSNGCAVRSWTAGKVTILGRHCAKDGTNKITFYNDVAGDQLDQYAKMIERDREAKPEAKKPVIDRDNF